MVANYFPANVGIGGIREALIFLGYGLNFTTPVATRNTPIARVEYNIRSTSVIPSGSSSFSTNWMYYTSSEILQPNGSLFLNPPVAVSGGNGVKRYNPTDFTTYKECYVYLGAWC